MSNPVNITVFRWAGAWGPFKVNIPCGECALTHDIIQDCIDTDLAGIEVALDMRDWLSEWWKPLPKGGWHAPIVLVNGKIVSQGAALNRGVLTQAVIECAMSDTPMTGNHIFGKTGCPHCVRAKGYLAESGIESRYCDVVKDTRALYEMLARVKPVIGPKTPVTLPQIWIDGCMSAARMHSRICWGWPRSSPIQIVASVLSHPRVDRGLASGAAMIARSGAVCLARPVLG